MRRIEYTAPETLESCVEALSLSAGAVALAGGTDLIPRLKGNVAGPKTIVSLRNVEALRSVESGKDLNLGAMTRLADVSAHIVIPDSCEAIREAAGLIGSWQIRNVATVGGNLCNAAPSADTAPALLCLDARAVMVGADGERTCSLAEFFRGPGAAVLKPGELLRSIVIPEPSPMSGSSYVRHTPRNRMDLAVAGVGVAVTLEDDAIARASIGLGAVAPTPIRAPRAEATLIGRAPSKGWLDDLGEAACAECAPIDDQRASAAFRRHLVEVFVKRAVGVAYERAMAAKGRDA